MSTRVGWALAIGGSAWLLGVIVYLAALIRQRPEDAGIAFLYNAPIAFHLKFALFRGPSGVPGIIAGVVFAAALVVLTRARRSAGHH